MPRLSRWHSLATAAPGAGVGSRARQPRLAHSARAQRPATPPPRPRPHRPRPATTASAAPGTAPTAPRRRFPVARPPPADAAPPAPIPQPPAAGRPPAPAPAPPRRPRPLPNRPGADRRRLPAATAKRRHPEPNRRRRRSRTGPGTAGAAPGTPEPPRRKPPPTQPPEPTPDLDPGVPRTGARAPAAGRRLALGIDGGYARLERQPKSTYRAALGAAVTRHEWDPADPVDAPGRPGARRPRAKSTPASTPCSAATSSATPTHYRDWVVAFVRRYGLGGSFWDEHPELDDSRYAITTDRARQRALLRRDVGRGLRRHRAPDPGSGQAASACRSR